MICIKCNVYQYKKEENELVSYRGSFSVVVVDKVTTASQKQPVILLKNRMFLNC